jgi:hypothetical protein
MITIAQIAHHEAGHAVSAVVLGVRFEYATIQENREKNTLGHTLFAPPEIIMGGGDQWSDILDELTEDRDHRSRIICALTGRRAEEKFVGTKIDSGFASDYRIVLRFFRRMGARNQDGRLYREWDGEAVRLVEGHWPEVTAVAKGLIEKARLSANEIKGIVGKVQESAARVTDLVVVGRGAGLQSTVFPLRGLAKSELTPRNRRAGESRHIPLIFSARMALVTRS